MDIAIPESVMLRAVNLAMAEMSAGLTEGHVIAEVRALPFSPLATPIKVDSFVATIVPRGVVKNDIGLRLAAVNGNVLS